MAISLTLFKSQFDNKTHRRMDFSSFDELEKLLYGLSKQPKKGKKDAELISPAVYEAGTTRANKNVLAWAGWCAVDVDDVTVDGELNDFVSKLAGSWRYVCYSTASSKIGKPKFRLVFELDRDLQQTEIKHFWFALQSHLDDRGDKQCKDLSRMYYIPADYADGYNFIFSGNSDPIDVDVLLSRYPYVDRVKSGNTFLDRLPPELAEQVVNHRKSVLEAQKNNIVWSDYTDCPFVNKALISEYKAIANIDNSGRYAMIYKIMVSIATNAIKREYPISTTEIVTLVKQLDRDTSNRYETRPLNLEADRALEYAYRNV